MKVHFIAIGGSIMHSLAIALKNNGHEVSGSDDQIFDPARSKLAAQGLLPEEGWSEDRIHPDLDAVILGMHAFKDNPELLKAKEMGLPIYSFPEFIAKEAEHKQRVVIAGSAGKTSITAMIMHVLQGLGKEFDYLVGAQLKGFNNPVKLSPTAPVILIEGDEYLSSKLDLRPKFLHYHPHILIISNISWDHINVFPTEAEYVAQFDLLLQTMEKAGSVIYNAEDEVLSQMVEKNTDPELHYVFPYSTPEYMATEEGFVISLEKNEAIMKVFGAHNMGNIHAAWKVCDLLGVGIHDFLDHMASFEGAGIRLEVIRENQHGTLIRDYAHAPSKVKASVDAVADRYPDKQVIACLELHTFSSLNKAFIPHYKHSLNKADKKLVFINPSAIEKRRLEKLDPDFIREAFDADELFIAESPLQLSEFVAENRVGGDVLLMMSSGNFGGLQLGSLLPT